MASCFPVGCLCIYTFAFSVEYSTCKFGAIVFCVRSLLQLIVKVDRAAPEPWMGAIRLCTSIVGVDVVATSFFSSLDLKMYIYVYRL